MATRGALAVVFREQADRLRMRLLRDPVVICGLGRKGLVLARSLRKAGERVVVIARLPHAFGGALALAYHATPRATQDIDLNLFVASEEAERVRVRLAPLGVQPPSAEQRQALRERGQARCFWEHVPIDLFFAYDPLHESCRERILRVPFGDGVVIPILSAEDLAIFKVLFDRDKDWRDLREMLFALGPDFDAVYALDWLCRILEPIDGRLARFEAMLRAEESA